MICTCIQNKDFDQIAEILGREDVEMAEIRLDRCRLSDEDIEELFSTSDTPLIATCRASECEDAERRLTLAIKAGARFADLEIEAPASTSKRFQKLCRSCGTTKRGGGAYDGNCHSATYHSARETRFQNRTRTFGMFHCYP